MPLVKRISDAFWDYVSPNKDSVAQESSASDLLMTPAIQPRATALPIRKRLETPRTNSRSMSPASRVRGWHMPSPPDTQSDVASSAGRKRKAPSYSPKAPKRKIFKSIETPSDLEGDILLEESDDGAGSVIQVAGNSNVRGSMAWDEQDITLVEPGAAPYRHPTARVSTPAESQYTTNSATSSTIWPADTHNLIQRIKKRGREPILPSHWQLDFSFLPDGLFMPQTSTTPAYISARSDRHFRATKAFADLIEMGARARDDVLLRIDPEVMLLNRVVRYLQWAEQDSGMQGKMAKFIDSEYGTKTTPIRDIQDALENKLINLRRGLRRITHGYEMPTVYGLLATHTVIAVVAYNPDHEEVRGMREIALFDFGLKDYDVWNAFAMALLVMHIRDCCTKMIEAGVVDVRWDAEIRRARELSKKQDIDA